MLLQAFGETLWSYLVKLKLHIAYHQAIPLQEKHPHTYTPGGCTMLMAALFERVKGHFNPIDCSPPGSSVHGILQARILEWVAIPISSGSSQPRDRTWVSYTAGRFFTI